MLMGSAPIARPAIRAGLTLELSGPRARGFSVGITRHEEDMDHFICWFYAGESSDENSLEICHRFPIASYMTAFATISIGTLQACLVT
jgi:hypothetical protein